MTKKKNSPKLSRKEYLAKWRSDNPNYFKTYYWSHRKEVSVTTARYRNSKKGKAKIKAYEQTKARKASKKAYQKSLVHAKNTLDKLKVCIECGKKKEPMSKGFDRCMNCLSKMER